MILFIQYSPCDGTRKPSNILYRIPSNNIVTITDLRINDQAMARGAILPFYKRVLQYRNYKH
jgi:hypothetical protein